MKRVTVFLTLFVVNLWVLLTPCLLLSGDVHWKNVDEGLFLKEFDFREVSNAKVTIVKIDPKVYSFKLLSASELGKVKMTPKQWCQKCSLFSAINAGMYQEDGLKNVGYMKNFNHINNSRLNTYKAILAFNPVDPDVPEIQIIDLQYQDFDKLKSKYHTLIQNIRMISCQQENVWKRQEKASSIAAFGIDKDGNAMFIFTEAPFSGHDFGNILLSLPISIYNAMYLEGGPEANLYFSGMGIEFEKGGIDTGFKEAVKVLVRPVPNVIGIEKRR